MQMIVQRLAEAYASNTYAATFPPMLLNPESAIGTTKAIGSSVPTRVNLASARARPAPGRSLLLGSCQCTTERSPSAAPA